jgi:hypothetical protein
VPSREAAATRNTGCVHKNIGLLVRERRTEAGTLRAFAPAKVPPAI